MRKINWGILSTGTIAKRFAATMKQRTDACSLLAVASRHKDSAEQFAQTYNIPNTYGSYLDLVQDPDVDIIYIATPHSLHYENAKLCLEHGKNVLCEKSFTVNAAQASELFRIAREKGLFIMEAFWTKFLPAFTLLKETVAKGAIGDITHFRAQYGFAPQGARYVRKFDPQLAGGTLLDIGVYAIGVACMLLGYQPKHMHSCAIMGEYGTDQFDSIMLEYEAGISAHLITTIGTQLDTQAVLFGTKGHIVLPNFTGLQNFTVFPADGASYTLEAPFEIDGFEYQIREAEQCLLTHKRESSIMTHENTLDVMNLMDQARSAWKLTFPCE